MNCFLSANDVTMLLVCLEEVTISDAVAKQLDLKQRLCRHLRKFAPDFYADLIAAGKFEDNALAKRPHPKRK